MTRTTFRAAGVLILLWWCQPAAGQTGQPVPPLSPAEVSETNPPQPPPGTEKVLSFDKHGTRVAACAQKAGAAIERAGRRFPPTEVWITDGSVVWKTGAVAGACDPAWSPDGTRLAVAAPDGIWIFAGEQQQTGERFTDVRDADAGGSSATATFSTPRWSPDGLRLAALVSDSTTSWVEVMDVATGKLLARSEAGVREFTWNPDSRTVQVDGRATLTVPR
jgi:dipeptidyl aminopeptidase/acylaminoacyl peptidase